MSSVLLHSLLLLLTLFSRLAPPTHFLFSQSLLVVTNVCLLCLAFSLEAPSLSLLLFLCFILPLFFPSLFYYVTLSQKTNVSDTSHLSDLKALKSSINLDEVDMNASKCALLSSRFFSATEDFINCINESSFIYSLTPLILKNSAHCNLSKHSLSNINPFATMYSVYHQALTLQHISQKLWTQLR